MVGMAEIELDRETGMVEVLNFDAVVDCGIPINPTPASPRSTWQEKLRLR